MHGSLCHPQWKSADSKLLCWFVHACFSHIPEHHPLSYHTTHQPTQRPVCVQPARYLVHKLFHFSFSAIRPPHIHALWWLPLQACHIVSGHLRDILQSCAGRCLCPACKLEGSSVEGVIICRCLSPSSPAVLSVFGLI